MGLLDEAIREHLELKRRRGADAGEISREESEALGPVRRAPDGTPELPAIPASAHETEYDQPVAAEPEALTGPGWEDETAIHVPQDEPAAYEPPAPPPPPPAYQPPAPPRPSAYEPPAPPPPAYEPPAPPRPSAYEPPAPPPPAYEPPAPLRPSSYEPPAPPPVRRDPPPAFEPLLPPSVASPSTPPPPAAGHEPPPLLDPDPSPPAATPPPPREKSRFGAAARPLRLRRRGKGDDAPGEAPPPGRFGAHDRQTPAHEPVQEPFYAPPSRPGSASPPPPYQPPPPAAREPAGEDLLEETPEFLEETPDHDRLWFEQRPPRDFDFDG